MHIVQNVAQVDLVALNNEIKWKTVYQRSGPLPRLLAAQSDYFEGYCPIYRHPIDEYLEPVPFTFTVLLIKQKLEALVDQKFNHCLIQRYRHGMDNIGEHSDKTLDIVPGTVIVNYSVGAKRILVLKPKKGGPKLRFELFDNSAFIMDLETNGKYMHAIRKDNRLTASTNKVFDTPEVHPIQDSNVERISLTFRTIGTFVNMKLRTIYGQGAKDKVNANPISDCKQESQRLLVEFAKENHSKSMYDYKEGFDVIMTRIHETA
jgi:soluble cytochrome b562